MNELPQDVQINVGDSVIFKSTDGDFSIDGLTAVIMEINIMDNDFVFPKKLAVRIKFDDNQRETWCMYTELTKAP